MILYRKDLYWDQSRCIYFSGNAAMIIWSPFILDDLAGLRDSAPHTLNNDPQSCGLVAATSIVPPFAGPSNPDGAAWGQLRFFCITSDAQTDAAMDFVEYSLPGGLSVTKLDPR
ncbi:hypothetical protein P775_14685 [Puniceibacterium antarcticum]|uniref:Uncharacterized protein n=2 Tax=Puniceibacterium antarcticum TaxID=1206336 RepID=A0A2G8RCT7_9RHOB|nr:hypothetical protein P775_14685 [Puniceibacterium antarcticum]